jgi:hypothetical protein
VVDQGRVYWLNAAAGTAMAVSKEGGQPVTLAAGQHLSGESPVGLIAADDAAVYWLTEYALMKVAK